MLCHKGEECILKSHIDCFSKFGSKNIVGWLVTFHHHVPPSCSTVTLHRHIPPSRSTVTFHHHVTQSCSTITFNSHVQQSRSTVTFHRHVQPSRSKVTFRASVMSVISVTFIHEVTLCIVDSSH